MKNALKVLLATLLATCFAAQVSVFAAPQMTADVNVGADEVYEDEVQVDEDEPVYEEIEDVEEAEDFEEADEADDAEEVVEEEDPNEVLVLFSEDGEVIYLAKKIAFSATKEYLAYGTSKTLTATITPEETTDKTITWASSNESVATVDQNGVVTAGEIKGTAKITAETVNGKKATCTVYVGAPADVVEISAMKSTSLAVGKTLTLKAKASCEDGDKPVSTAVTFDIVEGQEYATIDDKGKIKGVDTGEVVVRATAVAGTETAYDEVTINVCIPIASVKFAQSKVNLALGETSELQQPVLSPEDHTDTLKFYSDDESVVMIDEDGYLVPVSVGTAKIYAEAGSGKKASYTVTVVYPEDKFVLALSKESVKATADEVTMEVMLVNNPGIAGVMLELEFDDSVFEIASVEGEDFSEFGIVPGADVHSPYKILAYNTSNVPGDGTLVTVTFNILEGAEKGTYDVVVKSNSEEENLMIVDENGQVLDHLAVNGMITLR